MELVKVLDDLYHIARRLKDIDERYELCFNRKLKRFEVYANGAMQVALPFDRLDVRALDYVRKTRLENLNVVLEEIEKNNARIDALNQKKARENAFAQMEESLCK